MQPASWSLCFFLAEQTQTTLRSAKFTKTRENITTCAYLLLACCLHWLAPGLLCMACVLLPSGRFAAQAWCFCTSVLLCLACSWLAQLDLCCLGLACCAPWVYPGSALGLPGVYPGSTQGLPWVYPGSTQRRVGNE